MESFFVKRTRLETDGPLAGQVRTGWVGPLPTEPRANREADAWRTAGWSAEVLPFTLALRAEVTAWQRAANQRLGRPTNFQVPQR